uniref:Uncharacterized protein n=1 Tax=Cacopsylla melanoneura TaxID=428564 RepID=A0A8D9EC38_9HEMI
MSTSCHLPVEPRNIGNLCFKLHYNHKNVIEVSISKRTSIFIDIGERGNSRDGGNVGDVCFVGFFQVSHIWYTPTSHLFISLSIFHLFPRNSLYISLGKTHLCIKCEIKVEEEPL